MLPGSGTLVVVMVRVPTLTPEVDWTLNVPSELQPFVPSEEMKLNIASLYHRQSSWSQTNNPENDPPIIVPVKE